MSAAVILSAGSSTRFGGFPKSRLRIGDETAVHRTARIAIEGAFSPTVIVAGLHVDEISLDLRDLDVVVFHHKDWSLGRTGSVQAGLTVAGTESDILLWPVDHPFVEAKTLRLLEEASMRDSLGVWFVPTFQGRGGHPVLLRPPVFGALSNLSPSAPLRGLLPSFGPQVLRVVVDDPGVVANVDTPEDYDRLAREWRNRQEARWTVD